MRTPLDDVAFLANSENRVAVLEHLATGPHSRHVLAELTGASRVTLARVLDDLEARRWITQRGQVSTITPLGEWVDEAFGDLCETMAAERRLREVSRWFPPAGFDFHVSALGDAEITRVHRADASAPISKLVEQFAVGGRLFAFSFAITSQFLDACWRHVLDGDVTWEWVFTPAVYDVLRDSPGMARQSREMLETGRAEFSVYDGEIPHVVIVSDERVNLRLADEDGAATALVQSDDERVRAWAVETFERYRRAGTPVGADAFPG